MLKYFIAKMESYYSNFRNDKIAMEYYNSYPLFLKLFNITDNLANHAKIKIENVDTEIEKFIESKMLTKKK